jgi:hypothetical protein
MAPAQKNYADITEPYGAEPRRVNTLLNMDKR